jgi:hypothetical protein
MTSSRKKSAHKQIFSSWQFLSAYSSNPVYVNTLMIQQVLAGPEWQRVNPCGTFTLNTQERLPLEQVACSPYATLLKFRPALRDQGQYLRGTPCPPFVLED